MMHCYFVEVSNLKVIIFFQLKEGNNSIGMKDLAQIIDVFFSLAFFEIFTEFFMQD